MSDSPWTYFFFTQLLVIKYEACIASHGCPLSVIDYTTLYADVILKLFRQTPIQKALLTIYFSHTGIKGHSFLFF